MTMTLAQAITAVAPHASKDKTLPVLTHVRVRNGKVSATDRYTLAIVTLPETVLDPQIDCLLSPEDVKSGIVGLTNTPDGVVLTLKNGATKPANTDPDERNHYPNLAPVVENSTAPTEPILQMSWNPDYMVRFHAKHFGIPARNAKFTSPIFSFGATAAKPIRVTFADYPEFVGLIVPLRMMV